MLRRPWSFRSVLLATLLAVVAAPMAVVGVATYVGGRRTAREMARASVRQGLLRAEARVRSFLRDALDHDALHRELLPQGPLRATDLPPIFAQLATSFAVHKELTNIGLGLEDSGDYWLLTRKADDRVVVRTFTVRTEWAREHVAERGMRLLPLPDPVRVTPRDCRQRPYYEAAKKEGKSVWTDIYLFHNVDRGEAPGITYATPVYDGARLVAVLDVDYDIRALARIVDDALADVPGLLYLVEARSDGTRRLVVGPGARGPAGAAGEELEAAVGDWLLPRLTEGGEERLLSGGVTYLVGHWPLRGDDMPRWHLVLALPEDEVMGGVRATGWLLAAVFVVSVAGAVGAAYVLAGLLSRPLSRLREQTQALAAGRLDTPIAVCGPRDVAELAAGFNRMAADVHARHLELRASQELFAKAFRASPAAMSLTRLSDRCHLEVNAVWERLTGVCRGDALGKSVAELGLKTSPPAGDQVYAWLARGEALRDLEVTVERRCGEPVVGLLSAEPMDLNGEPCALWIFSDITQIKRHEEILVGLNAELEARVAERTTQLQSANRELEAFCYSVSHDLRAPLRSVDGFSKALLEDYQDKLDAEGRDYLQRVRAAARRMGELIDDLLLLSRVSRGEMTKSSVDLSALARRVADALTATQPERAVVWDIAEGVRAEGDANLLRIVLENLLGNAWKYTGCHATARIAFGTVASERGLVYYVRDDGAGFDPAYANKLFQPFQRLHRLDEFEGHGIGLATVQRIVHRHGGRVWAEGAVERGATFFFSFGGSRP